MHSDNDIASVAYLRIKRASLVPKGDTSFELRIPPLLEDLDFQDSPLAGDALVPTSEPELPQDKSHPLPPASAKQGYWIGVANIQAPHVSQTTSISEEVAACFELLKGQEFSHRFYSPSPDGVNSQSTSPASTPSSHTVKISMYIYHPWTSSPR